MTAPTRRAWVTATADAVARTLDGMCVIAVALWRGACAYMRTCPTRRRKKGTGEGDAQLWVALSYLVWGGTLAGVLLIPAALLITAGWPGALLATTASIAAAWHAGRPHEDAAQQSAGDQGEQQDENERAYRIRGALLLALILTGGVGLIAVPGLIGIAVTATAWGVAGWIGHRHAPPENEHAAPPENEHAAPAAVEDGYAEEEPIDPIIQLCWQLSEGVSGVHTHALVAALNRNPAATPLTASDVRAHLTALGVRERGGVRGWRSGHLGGSKGTSPGIHRDDLTAATGPCPEPLPPLPAWAVAAPVATATTQARGGVATATTGAATPVATPATGVSIAPDPDQPHRHTVHHH